ncbi:MAG: DNA repair protein RecO [Proteobacteria bacterium]|nr:DNA repair protein RecO [Pseudomonadota bacterium]MBU1710349.1 DNA repair protein RecO [Pseudomonadota bacterium]
MLLKQTTAVVINSRDHGESDVIITLYSLENGKFTAIAKGAKRSKKRFVNRLELFTLLDIQYEPGKRSTMARLDQAEVFNHFSVLRTDYLRYAAAQLICESLYFWTKENDYEPELFALLLWALNSLDQHGYSKETIIFFFLKMLSILGYQPNLSNCTQCGSLDAINAPFCFRTGANGIICAKCNKELEKSSRTMALGTIKLLLKAQNLSLEKLDRLRFSKPSAAEAFDMLKQYSTHLLQRELNSWKPLI